MSGSCGNILYAVGTTSSSRGLAADNLNGGTGTNLVMDAINNKTYSVATFGSAYPYWSPYYTVDQSGNITIAAGASLGDIEGGAPTPVTGTDFLWGDSTAHRLKMSNNGGAAQNVVGSSDVFTSNTSFVTAPSGQAGTGIVATLNTNKLWKVFLPYSLTTTQVTFNVTTVDNSANLYDLGIYAGPGQTLSSGTLICDTGAFAGTTIGAATGVFTKSWTNSTNCPSGTATLAPGVYYVGYTGNAATLALGGNASSPWTPLANSSAGASSGGALSASVTPAADSWSVAGILSVVIR